MINLKTKIELGVVPTHIKFVGGLIPDEDGKLPRGQDNENLVITEMNNLMSKSKVNINSIQLPVFPNTNNYDLEELITKLKSLNLKIYLILMVGGVDPMNPNDEDAIVEMLSSGINIAKKYNITHVASTSIEEWMQEGAEEKLGDDFQSSIVQNVKVHCRVAKETDIKNSSIKSWDIEFLRKGEFQTFNNIEKCWNFVKKANEEYGEKLFKVMVDAAHCGDSSLNIYENKNLISKIAKAGEMGMFHASAKTTRGCLSTSDGWVESLLEECAKTGKLNHVFVEVFHHNDLALEQLRKLDTNHGINTTDDRDYSEVVTDGLEWVSRVLNNLYSRKILKN